MSAEAIGRASPVLFATLPQMRIKEKALSLVYYISQQVVVKNKRGKHLFFTEIFKKRKSNL